MKVRAIIAALAVLALAGCKDKATFRPAETGSPAVYGVEGDICQDPGAIGQTAAGVKIYCGRFGLDTQARWHRMDH